MSPVFPGVDLSEFPSRIAPETVTEMQGHVPFEFSVNYSKESPRNASRDSVTSFF